MPHIHEVYDFTVSGHIVHDNRTLLIKHKKLGIWTPPGGHIELNQDPIEALFAEISEEAGIAKKYLTIVSPYSKNLYFKRQKAAKALPVPFDIDKHHVSKTHSHIDLGYVLISDSGDVEPGPGESNNWSWVNARELEMFKDLPESIRSRALYALKLAADQ